MEPNFNQPNQPTPPGSYGNFNFSQEKSKKKFNMMIIPTVLLSLAVIALVIFLFSYKNKYQYQRDNVQNIANQQVAAAKKEQKVTLDKEYAEQSKSPYLTYEGPSELGSVKISYPRNWSVYIDQNQGKKLFDFYSHPIVVPSANLDKKYALRVAITSDSYQNALSGYEKDSKSKKITISPYQVSGVSGARIDGEINKDQDGSLVVLPVRDKVLYVWTEDKTYIADFNNIVLKNLSFIP
ncbi:MAG TPA: hypothetical protein PKA29_00175 [Candidatus Saccharibacteria bacterium]|jgi:hypothetical protein|nr:hypothetical protein [Candidatus Saccharibacteria bacterium]